MVTIDRVDAYVESCVLEMEGYAIDRDLLPNNRGVRMVDHALRSAQRKEVATILTPTVNIHGIRFDPAARIGVALKVWWARERDQNYDLRYFPFPDGDNLNAACKGLIDGLADALGVNDRRFEVQPPSQLRTEGDPCVAIHLTAIVPQPPRSSPSSGDGRILVLSRILRDIERSARGIEDQGANITNPQPLINLFYAVDEMREVLGWTRGEIELPGTNSLPAHPPEAT